MSPSSQRRSLSLRLQPYAEDPMGLVADYLNHHIGKPALPTYVAQLLVMCLLPYALAWRKQASPEELQNCYWKSWDGLMKHFSVMGQALPISHPGLLTAPQVAVPVSVPTDQPDDWLSSAHVNVSSGELDSLFGDD